MLKEPTGVKNPAQKIVVLAGAGLSQESGINTFRGQNGLWNNHRIEEVASPEGFLANPDLVYEFYNQRREFLLSPSVAPNRAHFSLADLQRARPDTVIISQNVDDLLERAGCSSVLHIHGEILKMCCLASNKVFECRDALDAGTKCTCCTPPSRLRPHIVWFGEIPFFMDEVHEALKSASIFIAVGTSGNVYPAAGFGSAAKSWGARTVCINLEATANSSDFDETIIGKASEAVPAFIEGLL